MDIQLLVQKDDQVTSIPFRVENMVNAGFTGRNQEDVRHHLDELSAKGIEVPGETPVLYPVIPATLVPDAEIRVFGEETSGEIEYILFIKNRDEIYVGIGSDHTDRKLEETDIPRAKQICPNVFSPVVWPLADILDHWDKLTMGCDVEKDGQRLVYQKGGLDQLMSPGALMDLIGGRVKGGLENTVIYSGTLKMETEDFVFADRFEGRLEDPVLGRSIGFTYGIRPLEGLEKDKP